MLVLLVFTILYAGASYVSNKNLGTSVKTIIVDGLKR